MLPRPDRFGTCRGAVPQGHASRCYVIIVNYRQIKAERVGVGSFHSVKTRSREFSSIRSSRCWVANGRGAGHRVLCGAGRCIRSVMSRRVAYIRGVEWGAGCSVLPHPPPPSPARVICCAREVKEGMWYRTYTHLLPASSHVLVRHAPRAVEILRV